MSEANFNYTLETAGLVHSFGDGSPVLDDVSLAVEAGSIYGFLGPNGAGKTTTLRLILGLLKRQQGTITIFGKALESHRIETLRRIGSMIESPSIYSHLTARENLALLQKIYECPRSRIGEVLELVGLADTGKKKAGQFSLGMKQRLAIAIALLADPQLLILDEPTNGLDPNGIIEVRELLRELNRERGITILVSSHLLSEIDRLVSHVGIINRGRMLFQGTLDELKVQQQRSTHVQLETSDTAVTLTVLGRGGIEAQLEDGKFVLPAMERHEIAKLNRDLVAAGVEVYEIGVVRSDLERIFIDMVSD
ncbi:MAG TPA: ABC transporter ATP-binding protein [Pyrinomonadaceae bacterium]|nr:ABC transporter ATP-binding protein [Pyrinomonadaceae bacterium]